MATPVQWENIAPTPIAARLRRLKKAGFFRSEELLAAVRQFEALALFLTIGDWQRGAFRFHWRWICVDAVRMADEFLDFPGGFCFQWPGLR